MKITANSSPFELEDTTTLPQFLESIGLQAGLVVIELNHTALSPSEAETTQLQDGDSLEIVKIVAGG